MSGSSLRSSTPEERRPGALPLLYGMAEEIVADVTSHPEPPPEPEPSRPASGRRRCRLYAVGFIPGRDR